MRKLLPYGERYSWQRCWDGPQPAYTEQYTVIVITLGVLQNWRVSQDRKRKCQRGSACRMGRSQKGPEPRSAITTTNSNSLRTLVYSKYNFLGLSTSHTHVKSPDFLNEFLC